MAEFVDLSYDDQFRPPMAVFSVAPESVAKGIKREAAPGELVGEVTKTTLPLVELDYLSTDSDN